jgi:hypothetical protein
LGKDLRGLKGEISGGESSVTDVKVGWRRKTMTLAWQVGPTRQREREKERYRFGEGKKMDRGLLPLLGRKGSSRPFFFLFLFLFFFYFLISFISFSNLVQIASNQFVKIS